MEIKRLADSVARKYGTRNPFEILKCMNSIVVVLPMKGTNGFYQYFQRNNIIYINEDLPYNEQIRVCAHELGHMLLHKKSNAIFMDSKTNFNIDKFEIEANQFASYLLISDEIIKENKDFTIDQISRMLGYDKELVKIRLSL